MPFSLKDVVQLFNGVVFAVANAKAPRLRSEDALRPLGVVF